MSQSTPVILKVLIKNSVTYLLMSQNWQEGESFDAASYGNSIQQKLDSECKKKEEKEVCQWNLMIKVNDKRQGTIESHYGCHLRRSGRLLLE